MITELVIAAAIVGTPVGLIVMARRRRALRRKAEHDRKIEAMFRSLPPSRPATPTVYRIDRDRNQMIREELERRERRGPRPTSERVNELDAVDPLATAALVYGVLSQFGGPTNSAPVEAKFEGKGGESGGAGASVTWDEPHNPVREATPESVQIATPFFETSERVIEVSDPEPETTDTGSVSSE